MNEYYRIRWCVELSLQLTHVWCDSGIDSVQQPQSFFDLIFFTTNKIVLFRKSQILRDAKKTTPLRLSSIDPFFFLGNLSSIDPAITIRRKTGLV